MLTTQEVQYIQRSITADANDRILTFFDALSDSARFRLFKLLLKEKDLCVTDLARVCGVSIPAASQQLRNLEMSGLIQKERRGQTICYKVKQSDPVVRAIIKLITKKI